jgi:small subunit ribosomal protein S4
MAQATPTPATSYSSGQPLPQQQRPQQSAARGRKVSDYGRQLAEKQKARNEYGLRETQFRRYFTQAAKSKVATDQALFTALERRLDNVLFRSGIAKSRAMGRQIVVHGLVTVDGKRVNVPAYQVSEGETIALKKADMFEYNKDMIVPSWMNYSAKSKSVKVERMPRAEDLPSDINSQLIIEYYSR